MIVERQRWKDGADDKVCSVVNCLHCRFKLRKYCTGNEIRTLKLPSVEAAQVTSAYSAMFCDGSCGHPVITVIHTESSLRLYWVCYLIQNAH